MAEEPAPQTIDVRHLGNAAAAQAGVRAYARALGFPLDESERLALVASELATNLVRHGGGGTLALAPVRAGHRSGIQIVAEDAGPGIADVDRALEDGYSTSGGLGLGLGTVHRLMDELEIGARPGGGTRVACQRWHPSSSCDRFRLLTCGVATRCRPGEKENGDAFLIANGPRMTLVGVIDGLGHGALAHQAAQRARLFVEAHCDQPLDRLFAEMNRACRQTRGVAAALARFEEGAGQFQFASVGNIEARLFGSPEQRTFVVRRGIVGCQAPAPVVTTHTWLRESVLVLHSDGVRSRWGWGELPADAWAVPSKAAQGLLHRFAKDDDDATVVVVRHA
jgi:anti-sigma regulatory factor (Ser/Thr protein kinase)